MMKVFHLSMNGKMVDTVKRMWCGSESSFISFRITIVGIISFMM